MATQLNIKDADTIALARRVAAQRGTSMTAAVREGLRAIEVKPVNDHPKGWTKEQQHAFDTLMEISARTAPKLRAAGVTMENWDEGIYDYLYEDDFKG